MKQVDAELQPETGDLSAYLQADDVIDWTCDAIQSMARQIAAGLTSDVDRARALFEWVRDTIPHSHDALREEVTCSASDVLRIGTGICYAKAHLLAALLRASGIPAGFCYQVYHEPMHVSDDKVALHGLNGIYLTSHRRWVRADCRGNKEGVDSQFSIDREQLAFPEQPYLDDLVYAKPLPQVVSALRQWPTRSSLWPNLPVPMRSMLGAGAWDF